MASNYFHETQSKAIISAYICFHIEAGPCETAIAAGAFAFSCLRMRFMFIVDV
jgi:hypothetical protein